ncbi:MAG: TraB/GumN family protein [Candidatus Woesearchaeota archaeon]
MSLTIIGTSHIARQSIEEIKQAFEAKPDIVALELDSKRFYALTHNVKGMPNIAKIGLKGFMFSLVGQWAQQTLGKQVGVSPGAEMRTAIRLARKHKVQICLIDQDIEVTLKRFSETLSWRERFRIVGDVVKGFFKKEDYGIDLSKVPDKAIIKKLLLEVKSRYPNIYKVLVEERNVVMARNLAKLMLRYPEQKILAIVGAGHEDELSALVKKYSLSYSFSVAM